MADIDHIEIVPDEFGWSVRVYTDGINFEKHDIGDAIQWVHETERTLGKWLADGPADFHASGDVRLEGWRWWREGDPSDPDLARDLERGK